MTRTAGSGNKPKTVKELTKMLQDAAEREQVELSKENIAAILNEAKVQSAEAGGDEAAQAAAAKAAAEKINKFANLNISVDDDDEADTFKCGACGEIMASEMKHCPNCGTELNW